MPRDVPDLVRGYLRYLELFEESLYMPPKKKPVPRRSEPLAGGITPLPRNLETFRERISNCEACPLGKARAHIVFGEGDPHARIVFVGEAPGAEEDKQGKPFVGRAGQLLGELLGGIGLTRDDVFICNVLKCRPPNNRDPEPREIEACSPYLLTQLSLIAPAIIVCLGRHAASTLLGTDAPMRELRGRTLPWKGMQVLVTYHPAYYLRNSSQLQLGEQDFQLLRRLYDELPD
jgi:DNA polymerase